MYLLVDSTSNIVQWGGESMPSSIPSGQVLATVSDTDPNAQGVQSRPTDYTYSGGVLARRPYFTLAYDHTANVLTATLNEAPTTLPASVTFAVAGQTFTSAPTSTTDATTNVTTVTAKASISVHAALQPYSVVVSVSADGFVSNSIDVGNTMKTPPVATQAYQAAGSTVWTVAPTGTGSKSFLESWYALSPATIQSLLADIGTAVSFSSSITFGKVPAALRLLGSLVKWAQQATYAPFSPSTQDTSDISTIALSTNETNAINDVNSSVLPNLYTTLANAYPSGGTKQLQFQHYEDDLAKTYKAFSDYTNDLNTIPNLA